MPIFDQGDVIKVPFPYTDRATRQSRPALVVSVPELEVAHSLLWVSMITSAENRGWDGDVEILDLERAGLPARSLIRTAKLVTIEAADGTRLGRIDASVLDDVLNRIRMTLTRRVSDDPSKRKNP